MTDPIHTTPATEPEVTASAVRPLESLLDGTGAMFPTVRLSYPPAEAVVLAVRDRQVDVVLDTGFARTVALSDAAEVIDDPGPAGRVAAPSATDPGRAGGAGAGGPAAGRRPAP